MARVYDENGNRKEPDDIHELMYKMYSDGMTAGPNQGSSERTLGAGTVLCCLLSISIPLKFGVVSVSIFISISLDSPPQPAICNPHKIVIVANRMFKPL